MVAYQWGRKGYESGMAFSSCPYPPGCQAAADWRRGYCDAKLDDTAISYLRSKIT